ncbi:MAG: divergent PAP2 family protein [Clostridia bacterium]|nr:divergent PAP2 family protein [Clostridia bacterium]
MTIVRQFLENRIMWIGVLAWVVAQLGKVVITLMVERRLDLSRMFGLGGMPSSHAAVVSAVAAAVGIRMGFNSALFAIALTIALVTMVDAAGVRRAAGQQAVMLNRVVQEIIEGGGDLPNETLRELLGHTPLQVFVGSILGTVLAILIA